MKLKALFGAGSLAVAITTSGCFDLVTNEMKPGERRELNDFKYGNEYTVSGCVIERVDLDGNVVVDDSNLQVFEAARLSEEDAWDQYLGRSVIVTGTVTETSNLIQWVTVAIADNLKATIQVSEEMTDAELNALVGNEVSFVGKIKDLNQFRVTVYDGAVE